MLLYIVRHGDPDYDTDSLTPRGVLQAEAVAKRLCNTGINQIFSSPMGRAKQTAEPLCRLLDLPCQIEPWTHEIEAEMLSSYPDLGFGSTQGSVYAQNSHILGNGGYDLSYGHTFESPMFKGTKMDEVQQYIEENGKAFLERLGYREENGAFTSRPQLKKVPKLGPKAYQQCAGFLRVPESKEILDNTGVHPETYDATGKLLELCGYTKKDVATGKLEELSARFAAFGAEKASEACGVGVPTLEDVIKELQKPGRDPRDDLPAPILRTDVLEMKDLKPGMVLSGTVRNVIDFGVFVDIGVHQDGLVHISQVCNRKVRHPSEIVQVGDIVKVAVLDVDVERKRISLTMKNIPAEG